MTFSGSNFEYYYVPITIRILNSTTRNKIFGLSGIYLYVKPLDPKQAPKELILSLISLPDEYMSIQTKLEIFFTTKELINNQVSGKENIQWIQCKLIKFQKLIDPDVPPSSDIDHLISNGFEFQTSNENNKNNNVKDTCLLVSKPKFSMFNNLLDRKIKFLSSKMKIEIPSKIRIESSPFNISNVSVFNNFNSIGHLNYESLDGSYYLSDSKYLDNMIGGVVTLQNDEKMDHIYSLGLVWGNIVKGNGQGELLVVLSWSYIMRLLTDVFVNELGLNKDDADQLLTSKCCSSQEQSKFKVQPTKKLSSGLASAVGITITNLDGLSYWGSGVLFMNDLILTNRHVIMSGDKLTNEINIWINEGRSIRIIKPEIGKDVFIPFNNQLFDICFIRVPQIKKLSKKPITLYDVNSIDSAIFKIQERKNLEINYFDNSITKSIGYGLFFNRKRLTPLKSVGGLSTTIKLSSLFKNFPMDHQIPSLIISSSSCWSGSSGGALVSENEELIGVMVSNGRLSNGETLNMLNLVIPLDIILLGYYDLFYEKLEFDDESIVKVNNLYQLKELYNDLFIESVKL
ncbi:hypothetical protein CANARDRAFT_28130 [[Candida] arabinofermentans NRRL YB-2248]|uniref:Serine protease n=1 Tax=[Candida] arabinofermentans NRRL YB-2248 TaxID=983967 RepID=A0A1E4T2U8_9ASCO|nr:hypothetical protein CANARDRAFT_28130 [[Candida] arabinofermentans NRRL YB-2248]